MCLKADQSISIFVPFWSQYVKMHSTKVCHWMQLELKQICCFKLPSSNLPLYLSRAPSLFWLHLCSLSFVSHKKVVPHVTLHTISMAINLSFPIGRGLSNESVVSRERGGGAVEMSMAVFKAEWGVSYGHCSTVYITANEGSMWLHQDHLHISLSSALFSPQQKHAKQTGPWISPHLLRPKEGGGGWRETLHVHGIAPVAEGPGSFNWNSADCFFTSAGILLSVQQISNII